MFWGFFYIIQATAYYKVLLSTINEQVRDFA